MVGDKSGERENGGDGKRIEMCFRLDEGSGVSVRCLQNRTSLNMQLGSHDSS